jgi:hypothetical protein
VRIQRDTNRYSTSKDHMPEHHRQHAECTPERIIGWVGRSGPATADGPNMYGYVIGNPISFNDASGGCWGLVPAAIGGALGGLSGAITGLITAPGDGSEIERQIIAGAAGGFVAGGLLAGDPSSTVIILGTSAGAATTGLTYVAMRDGLNGAGPLSPNAPPGSSPIGPNTCGRCK